MPACTRRAKLTMISCLCLLHVLRSPAPSPSIVGLVSSLSCFSKSHRSIKHPFSIPTLATWARISHLAPITQGAGKVTRVTRGLGTCEGLNPWSCATVCHFPQPQATCQHLLDLLHGSSCWCDLFRVPPGSTCTCLRLSVFILYLVAQPLPKLSKRCNSASKSLMKELADCEDDGAWRRRMMMMMMLVSERMS